MIAIGVGISKINAMMSSRGLVSQIRMFDAEGLKGGVEAKLILEICLYLRKQYYYYKLKLFCIVGEQNYEKRVIRKF